MSRYIPEPPLGQTMDSRAFQAALDASPDAKYLLAKVKTNNSFCKSNTIMTYKETNKLLKRTIIFIGHVGWDSDSGSRIYDGERFQTQYSRRVNGDEISRYEYPINYFATIHTSLTAPLLFKLIKIYIISNAYRTNQRT